MKSDPWQRYTPLPIYIFSTDTIERGVNAVDKSIPPPATTGSPIKHFFVCEGEGVERCQGSNITGDYHDSFSEDPNSTDETKILAGSEESMSFGLR